MHIIREGVTGPNFKLLAPTLTTLSSHKSRYDSHYTYLRSRVMVFNAFVELNIWLRRLIKKHIKDFSLT